MGAVAGQLFGNNSATDTCPGAHFPECRTVECSALFLIVSLNRLVCFYGIIVENMNCRQSWTGPMTVTGPVSHKCPRPSPGVPGRETDVVKHSVYSQSSDIWR